VKITNKELFDMMYQINSVILWKGAVVVVIVW